MESLMKFGKIKIMMDLLISGTEMRDDAYSDAPPVFYNGGDNPFPRYFR
jgi:hypothetical protein